MLVVLTNFKGGYMSIVIGIDPGYSGGVAFYDPLVKRLVAVMPMPTITDNGVLTTIMDKKPKIEVDGHLLARALLRHREDVSVVAIEKVASSPQMGVVSSFRFGQGFGVVQGVVAALGLPVKYIFPGVWKPGMGLSADKEDSTAKAISLFPEWENTFRGRMNKSAGLAEAALIAHYVSKFSPPK